MRIIGHLSKQHFPSPDLNIFRHKIETLPKLTPRDIEDHSTSTVQECLVIIKRYKEAKIRKRRNQKKIPTPKT